MKNVSLLVCILALSAPAFAQEAPADAPVEGDGIAAPPEAIAEPEPEVSDPEPEVSEPEPEVSEPVQEPEPEVSDSGSALGTASPAARTSAPAQTAQTSAPDDTSPTNGTNGPRGDRGGQGAGSLQNADSNTGTLSAAERAASVTGGQGLPWTFPISWSNNMSVRTLSPPSQLTYDPFFSMSFVAAPRWIFSPRISIGARMGLDVEFTQSNFTPETRDLEWGDLQLDATFPLPWLPGGINISPSVVARIPTSQFSRAQNRYLGPTARVLFIKPFSVLQGFVTGLSLSYTGWIGGTDRRLLEGTAGVDGNTVPTSDGGELAIRDVAGDSGCARAYGDQTAAANAGGSTGPCTGGNQNRHQTSVAVFASLIPIPHLAFNFSFAWLYLVNNNHTTAYLPPDQVITADGQPLGIADTSPTHGTHITSLSLGVSYDFSTWLTVGLSWNTLAFYPDSDATVENPFYNENTQLSLSVAFRPAALTVQLREPSPEETATAALSRTVF